MNVFGKLFSRKQPQALEFRLNYEPTPENAPRFAEDMVQATKKIDGRDLDYTPDSLPILDEVLDGFSVDGIVEMRESLFGFGCYLGEVFVRHAGGPLGFELWPHSHPIVLLDLLAEAQITMPRCG